MTLRDDLTAALNDAAAALGRARTLAGQIPVDPAPAPTPTPAPAPAPTPVPAPAPAVPTLTIGMANGSNTDPAAIELRAGVPLHTSKTYYSATGGDSAAARIKANILAKRRVSEISFKPPQSWSSMATGAGDQWARDLAAKLKAAVGTSGHVVRIAIHHEPENDTISGTPANDGGTAAGRDAWKAMQARLAPLFPAPTFQFVAILMGYHSYSSSSALYTLWRPEASIPNTPALKGVGYDLYETRNPDDGTGWRNFDTYFGRIQAFHQTRPGLAWGISETGIAANAFAERATWYSDFAGKIRQYSGSWFTYFNSNLNSSRGWQMEPDSPRERAFIAMLKAAK